jgi:hypothetical protein
MNEIPRFERRVVYDFESLPPNKAVEEAVRSLTRRLSKQMDEAILTASTNTLTTKETEPLTLEKLEQMLARFSMRPTIDLWPLHFRYEGPTLKVEQNFRIRWQALHFAPKILQPFSRAIYFESGPSAARPPRPALHCVGQVGGVGIWSDPSLPDNQIKVVHPDGRVEIFEGEPWIDSF